MNTDNQAKRDERVNEAIASYLEADPAINDNWLAEIIGGVSKNTVADERRRLEEAGQINRLTARKTERRSADGPGSNLVIASASEAI